jgi:hypothetical protein
MLIHDQKPRHQREIAIIDGINSIPQLYKFVKVATGRFILKNMSLKKKKMASSDASHP